MWKTAAISASIPETQYPKSWFPSRAISSLDDGNDYVWKHIHPLPLIGWGAELLLSFEHCPRGVRITLITTARQLDSWIFLFFTHFFTKGKPQPYNHNALNIELYKLPYLYGHSHIKDWPCSQLVWIHFINELATNQPYQHQAIYDQDTIATHVSLPTWTFSPHISCMLSHLLNYSLWK